MNAAEAQAEVLDPAYRERLRQCLRAPSGQSVMVILAQAFEPLNAAQIAALAYLSTTAARQQAYRAAKLGYARQTMVPTKGHPAMAWQITETGRDFLIELGEMTS